MMIYDQEILDEFKIEATELLGNAEEDILELEDCSDKELVNRIFRAFHTIKGNASMIGFDLFASLAHHAEDTLTKVRSGVLIPNRKLVDLLLHVVDTQKTLLEKSLSQDSSPVDISGIIAELQAIVDNCGVKLDLGHTSETSYGETPPPRQGKTREMRILVAEDDVTSLMILQGILVKWGYEVVPASDGIAAWNILQDQNAPSLVILDWVMPGLDGIEICRRARQRETAKRPVYIILLTGRDSQEDIVNGLDAGADDYITKPFDNDELRARVQVGRRVVQLQTDLTHHVQKLQDALNHIKTLQGILPICSYCKKIRDDQNYWQQVESYISNFTDARFTHSICPDCFEKEVKPQLDNIKRKKGLL